MFECCDKAVSYDEYIELCRPIAKLILKHGFENGISRLLKAEPADDSDKR